MGILLQGGYEPSFRVMLELFIIRRRVNQGVRLSECIFESIGEGMKKEVGMVANVKDLFVMYSMIVTYVT